MHPWKSTLNRDALADRDRLFACMDAEADSRCEQNHALARTQALLALEFDHAWITALRDRAAPASPEVVSAVIHHVSEVLAPLSASPHDLFARERNCAELKEAFVQDGLLGLSGEVAFRAGVVEEQVAQDLEAWEAEKGQRPWKS